MSYHKGHMVKQHFSNKKTLLTKFSNESTQIRILLSCGVMQARNEPFVNRTIWLQSQPRLGVGASCGGAYVHLRCKFKEMTNICTLLEVLTFSTFSCLQNTWMSCKSKRRPPQSNRLIDPYCPRGPIWASLCNKTYIFNYMLSFLTKVFCFWAISESN